MVNLRKLVGSFFIVLLEKVKTLLTFKDNSLLITRANNPELINLVTKELENKKTDMILAKLQDLEKVVYHLAAKQQEMLVNQKCLEEVAVVTATGVEELLHGLEEAVEQNREQDSDSEDSPSFETWETKKGASHLN